MKNFAMVIIGLFFFITVALFAQQGHGYGGNTFFFEHKTVLICISIAIMAIFAVVWVKIPKK